MIDLFLAFFSLPIVLLLGQFYSFSALNSLICISVAHSILWSCTDVFHSSCQKWWALLSKRRRQLNCPNLKRASNVESFMKSKFCKRQGKDDRNNFRIDLKFFMQNSPTRVLQLENNLQQMRSTFARGSNDQPTEKTPGLLHRVPMREDFNKQVCKLYVLWKIMYYSEFPFAKHCFYTWLQFRRDRRLTQNCTIWERLWKVLRRGQRHKKKNETRHSRNSRLLLRSVKKYTRKISKCTFYCFLCEITNLHSSCLLYCQFLFFPCTFRLCILFPCA